MKKIVSNIFQIAKHYDLKQAIPNIWAYGLSTFLKNAVREMTSKQGSSDLFQNDSKEIPEEWRDYEIISALIKQTEALRLSGIKPNAVQIENIDEKNFFSYTEALEFTSASEPVVSIVIPVYNQIKFTVECLLSIKKHTKGTPYEIIIVDDRSTDETEQILTKIKGLTYLKNPANLGFLRTCNYGAQKARGIYTLFLNNDAQVTSGWLEALVKTFEDFERVGAVGPKILFPNGRLQEAGALINIDCTTRMTGFWDDPESPRFNYVRDVDYCSGTCLILETEKFREIGGFDEALAPAYCEDVDLCLRLRQKGFRIIYNPKAVVVHHLSVSSNSIDDSYKIQCATRNQQKISEKWQHVIDELNRLRLIAFYLPQFHPIPENDRWWGKGFTEWRNVAKARPNFKGHYQPHLPSDLGFYDLRVEKVMEEQAELARKYGIYGFCYYYYWFEGKRLLEMPIERMLQTGKPDFPFCLCWANESWSRRWDGKENELLMAQTYSAKDDQLVIKDIIRYMRHKNYIKIDGKPVLLIYRKDLFPDIRRTVKSWRDTCRKEGIGEIYLVMVESFEQATARENPYQFGFDASVEFPPHLGDTCVGAPEEILNSDFNGYVYDYRKTVLNYVKKEPLGQTSFRTVMPSWDNTPRKQNDSHIFAYSTPGTFQAWLEFIIKQTRERNFGDERMIFINAWNEWAEGAYLEPDQRYGHGFLEATRNAMVSDLLKGKQHGN